ncbi:unnamed protein product, partial [Rotaria magnacalcarata]
MKFLELENLIVNEQTFAIHKPYREVKLIRLLNVPAAISDALCSRYHIEMGR